MNEYILQEKNRKGLDCLLVHTPKLQTYYQPLNVYQSLRYMTIGLLALADLADRNGYRVRVLHLGIESALNKHFSFQNYLTKWNPKTIGFSLQFHQGIVDTIKHAREARLACPSAFIFTGGFTASYFAREILEIESSFDAVIKGDSEVPLLQILDTVVRERTDNRSNVSNLAWRNSHDIIENKQDYQIDEGMLNELVFTRFDLMENSSKYVNIPKIFLKTNLPNILNLKLNRMAFPEKRNIFWGLPVGRGCVSECFYCGGGAKAQFKINRRRGVIFRSQEKVIETINELIAFGFKGSYLSFDPHPWSQNYYIKLFRMMREREITFNIHFSAWGLPTHELLDEFVKTVGPSSSFLISPETGSDRLRKKSRANYYSNQELLNTIRYADNLGINTSIYFCIGVPSETRAEFRETLALKKEILSISKHAKVEAFLIEMEPGAPRYLDPDKYGITIHRHSLSDFIRDGSSSEYSFYSSLGWTSRFFDKIELSPKEFADKLLKLQCQHFCDRRLKCILMRGFWFISRLIGLAPSPKD